ncbi:GGDEF domain-containing protein [Clostridium botulinum]|uniref:bifunctional diguanylate cyclase/phosphodiesterase n=1 Tax=Clostridium TaxID=1485 RepID=UPI0013F6E547|nr:MULTISPECIES: GGDEF domain-containing protein [Clostridium]MCS6131326.1 GGDEF domain-containing protein [Clostridium botulinum]NFF80909.1 GGDEF domain-containing protein [Clostridium botulinum]NFL43955.1 GGDEF domain-containing protein [Clostridium botulinum]NFL88672.1 GGDEF domain-containing protein [Clostridium botulinum]
MNNKFKSNIFAYIIPITVIVMLIAIGFSVCIIEVKEVISKGNKSVIVKASENNSMFINYKLNDNIQYMKHISGIFNGLNDFSKEDVMEFLNLEEKEDFLTTGIITSDGILNCTDGSINDINNKDYFKKWKKTNEDIITIDTDLKSGEKVFIYVTSLFHDGKIQGALYGTLSFKDIEKLFISNSKFYQQVETYILDREGNILIGSGDLFNILKDNNIFSYNDLDDIEMLKDDLTNNRDGAVFITLDKNKYILSYSKISDLKDYYVLSLIDASNINEKQYHITFLMNILASFVILIFLILLIYLNSYRNRKEKLIKDIAFVDDITGGKTLTKFKMDIREILVENMNSSYALVEFDIVRFKIINDIWGYKTGDFLLKHISDILKNKLLYKEMFCRVRDDLFILLLKYKDENDLIDRINVLDNSMRFFDNGTKEVPNFSLSYGVYVIDGTEEDINKMIDNVAFARETSKSDCNEVIGFYDIGLQSKLIKQKQIEDVMYSALANRQFELYLQPKYDIKLESCVGAEALVRWNNPEKGLISPIDFIPLFEKNGFIVNLDMFIFEEVCSKINEWKKNNIKLIPISVNISRINLKNVDYFIKNISEIFNKYDINPNLIEIEITESAIFNHYDNMLEALLRLKAMGFSISLDDFGTGLSSLNILKDLPIDTIKLDREFLNSKDSSKKGEIVIANIVRMVKELDLNVICEGVETYEQAEFLSEVGCNNAQGYLYARPMPVKVFEEKELTLVVIQDVILKKP